MGVALRPPAERAETLSRLVANDIYQAGFAALQTRFGAAETRPLPALVRPPKAELETMAARAGAAPLPAGVLESRAIVVERYGGPEVMVPAVVRVPPPGPGEVRLRHSAIGVNFIDVYCRAGFFTLLQPPGIPGMEGAGTVIDVGPGVTHLQPGDRVVYACEPVGAYVQIRTMPAPLVIPLPADIDEETAAAIFLKGLAVEFMVHTIRPIRAGEVVLVHAAAGGMGLLLCQWAKALGADHRHRVQRRQGRTLARRRLRPCDRLHARGFRQRVLHLTGGRGADVISPRRRRTSAAPSTRSPYAAT